MAKKPETLFAERLAPKLAEIPHSWWTKIQAGSIRGIPDKLGVVRSRMIALELKVGFNTPDALQAHTLLKIHRAGGYARVIYPADVPDLLADLQAISEGKDVKREGIT